MSEVGIQSVRREEGDKVVRPRLLPSPGLGGWLKERGGSLVISTYQSSRVIFLSADQDGEGTVALERIVGSAMGLAVDRDKLWITNKEQAWRFSNVGSRALGEEGAKVDYDAVFMPRWGIFLGGCDTHDVLSQVRFGGRMYELLFVNTNYSCICSIDGHYNFVPVWKPDFISSIGPGDRCHLNGMGQRDGQLAYATACATTDTPGGWRAAKRDGGVLIDVQANRILSEGLSMPHSPRWHDGRVWLLNAGTGDFGHVDPATGRFEPVTLCPGFARGLTIVGNEAVVALSRLRPNTFASGLPIKERLESANIEQRCGLLVIDLGTGAIKHWLTIEGIGELYDVAFMEGVRRPYSPGFSEPELHRSLVNIPTTQEFPLGVTAPAGDPSETANATA